MEKSFKFDGLQPRQLRYRSHYKIYLVSLLTFSGFILFYWGYALTSHQWWSLYQESKEEAWLSLAFFVFFGLYYTFWLRYRLQSSLQVFSDKLVLNDHGKKMDLIFCEIESIGIVMRSVFYLKMKDGKKYYFSSSLERIDYVWEGLFEARKDLFDGLDYESFRLKLVQHDHHQKRKEWFFKHRLIDLCHWVIAPVSFLFIAYMIQSKEVAIHQQGLYFFRLTMYAALVLLVTSFIFSIVLKNFIFDKKIKLQMGSQTDDKLRDLEFEGLVLQRSKVMQVATAFFVFTLILKSGLNLYSVTKIKQDLADFNLKSGQTKLIDNRFNCIACKYPIRDGDLVVFGRGTIGQIMATQGDMVGQISQDQTGRMIASENIAEVPAGHVAIKIANQKEILMVKVDDLIGKIQK